ncbi:MAG: DUF599 family protein [Pseudomonadota bacterium]
MNEIPLIDWIALGVFITIWTFYTWYSDYSPSAKNSLPRVMNFHRKRWMREMLRRELRMPDALGIGNFVQSAVFFASTAILIIGGLVATLGGSSRAVDAISLLPFVVTPSESLWSIKVVILICVFIYAFVKFIWAVRLANYCMVLFNAAPIDAKADNIAYADELAKLAGLFALHFNQGLRANFFALAALGWWINATVFMLATAAVLWVVYRREFRSNSLKVANNLRDMSMRAENQD